jgi:phosphate transport system permease protein
LAEAREKARRKDRLAAAVITAVASLVLLAVSLLFLYLLREVWPLLRSPRLANAGHLQRGQVLAARPGELADSAWVLREDGALELLPGGERVSLEGVQPPVRQALTDRWGRWLGVRDHAAFTVFRVTPRVTFRGEQRVLELRVRKAASGDVGLFVPLALGGEGEPVAVGRCGSGLCLLQARGGSWELREFPQLDPRAAVVEEQGRRAWIATADTLLLWELDSGAALASAPLPAPPTSITLLLGDLTCVLGTEDGSVSLWEAYPAGEGVVVERKGQLGGSSPVLALAPGPRDKSFAILRPGMLELANLTSRKVAARVAMPREADRFLAFAPRSDGLLVGEGSGKLHRFALELGHPEVTLKTLFGRVRYEGYREAAWVWQSTGGSNAFESKYSLIPLILGSVKGAFYAMLFSAPLGLLAAVYTSQFLSQRARQLVKPVVELLAGVPSVVVGFVAALVLAPWVARHLFGILLALLVLPVVIVSWATVVQRLPRPAQLVYERRWEALATAGLVVLTIGGTALAAPLLEAWLFPGGFLGFLHDRWGVSYDQRNALVAGFALGFAVLPLIFSVAEEALSNVPASLLNAALSLGASRAKAVASVVVPAAAPGLLAALLLGFGRAVGETMIVLMASGNTPILSFSPFSGMRTLSACIAVELPEAAYGESLYRVLMLAALLLFLFTLLINLLGQVVARRLSARFGGVR